MHQKVIRNNIQMEDREKVEICQLQLFVETWWKRILIKSIASQRLQCLAWSFFSEVIRRLKAEFRKSLTGFRVLLCIMIFFFFSSIHRFKAANKQVLDCLTQAAQLVGFRLLLWLLHIETPKKLLIIILDYLMQSQAVWEHKTLGKQCSTSPGEHIIK